MASVASMYKLVEVLGVPVAKPIDILQPTIKQQQCLLRRRKQMAEEQALFRKVFKRFACCDITHVHKAPFDFIVNIPNEQQVILGAVAAQEEAFLEERVSEILSLCRVVGAYPMLVTEQVRPVAQDILCVCPDELSEVHTPEELVASY